MPTVCCRCKTNNCQGALIPAHTARAHERADLHNQTTSEQGNFQHIGECIILGPHEDAGPILRGFAVPLREPPTPISPNFEFYDFPPDLDDMVLDTGYEPEDLGSERPGDPLPYFGRNIQTPETLLAAIDHFDRYNAATAAGSRPLTPHDAHNLPRDQEEHNIQYQLQQAIQHAEENPDLDQDIDPDTNPLEDVDEYQDILGEAQPAEDDTDPFFIVDGLCAEDTTDLTHLPGHLVSIYAVVSWLHLQFHLPKVACNALLAIFACILLTLSPNIEPPFVTLQSSNRVLGVDKPIYTLPVCPPCRDVFPPACSPQSHDQCTLCNEDLFLPDKTACGNQRSLKSPLIKYPYLPLSDQIKSLLKVPGLESILDGWCSKPRSPNQYIDIFDGSVCKTKLKAPDGKLFFSNLPHEKAGPDGELHVGVNLGVDWFSYIRSNIAPSHSSCLTSFSICNLPPKYRYRTSNLMCTSILPGPKEQNLDQIQQFLRPNRFGPPSIMERWH
ncbi:uncharacterized protein EDB91DRAFT_1255845 [Suillus paluster]|uniref:uncharacterized protein n=1 Tax=Suillus paluster TaxID=48578 RepID=UPI001B860C61|nr:uncharacterized protein EDB91DRAFT_1255845 [Suillus paluster]KAG1722930.1 hypothetical protein EDB91DRAFT_1255845 [Suillus paluster]